jgi:predicted TIM-barrel fold metal-dependent hydrolase
MEASEERRRFIRSAFSYLAFGWASVLTLKKHSNDKSEKQVDSFISRSDASEKKSSPDLFKLDAFAHIAPKKYVDAFQKLSPNAVFNQPLWDMDQRFQMMDKLGNIAQVLTLVTPALETIPDPQKALDLARTANDGMAELVAKYPARFAAAAAALPLNSMDAALKELDRAINDLKLKGVQIFTSISGKPLDSPEFMPLYERMAGFDLPIWIHPLSHANHPFYPEDMGSKNDFDNSIGWPHATSMAMMRLAASGILEKFPKLKFITHHSGGTVPYLAGRIEFAPSRYENLTRPIIESLHKFYFDTAVQGNTANLMCARAFCGVDHQIFGTDFPMADTSMVERVVHSIDEMDITDAERQMIYAGNAKSLLGLTLS